MPVSLEIPAPFPDPTCRSIVCLALTLKVSSFGALSYAIDTYFIWQTIYCAEYREGLGVILPADKFVVLPDGAIISKSLPAVDYMYPEGCWQYCDWKGDPPESEDEDDY